MRPKVKSRQAAWQPLVEGETARQAVVAAEEIARDLAGEGVQTALGLSLSQGRTGLALFFAYLEQSLGWAEAGERAQHHLDQAISDLAAEQVPAAGLYHGFAGVAWVAEHLTCGETLPGDEDPNADIDAALLSILHRTPWQGEFDLLGGLVGWGVYALERMPRDSAVAMLHQVVARLDECADRQPRGITWRDPRNAMRRPDAGMAHGVAGVIALLARMLQEGAASREAVSLLNASVDGILNRADLEEADGEADLAWCAGDAGLSVALLAAGRASGRDECELAARRLAAGAAARYPDDPGGDPALCHGTAGLSHLFHRLYQATGDPALLAAAHRWLQRTLARRRPGEGIGGYRRRGRQADGHLGWTTDPGFLGGAAGIGLALLAAATPVEPEWDRLLLLSGRTRGGLARRPPAAR
jgi:lantibiotic biosynthesis protein